MKEVSKTIKETVARLVTVYVADDGKEFNSKESCIRYETDNCFETLFKKHSEDFREANGWPPYDSAGTTYDNDYFWMRIIDDEDIELIEKISCEIWCELNIGEIVCIETDYCSDRFCYSARGTFSSIASFLKNFGYGVVKLEG